MNHPQKTYRNQILQGLSPLDFRAIAPLLDPVHLSVQISLETANQPIERVCFPDSGIISVVATSEGLGTIEVGLIGSEGMTGLSIFMVQRHSPQDTYVQVPGAGHWIGAVALAALLESHPAMRQLMLSYAHVFTCQIGQTALANGRAKIDVRLARWLLMAADRIGGAEMPLTHELMAVMLGVRRPGITDALHRLQGNLAIKARRSAITIKNRAFLEALAGGTYGVPEREYLRVLGTVPNPAGGEQPDETEIHPNSAPESRCSANGAAALRAIAEPS